MASVPILSTRRLVLRQWRAADLLPFSNLNVDPRVMEHFPRTLTRDQSDAFVDKVRARLAEDGYGWWAVEVTETSEFVGFVGLSMPSFQAHFTPCLETGWRLAFQHWGKGYATEAAQAALAHAYRVLGIDEVVAFTAAPNERSRKVMERLGMKRLPTDDFDHPTIPDGSPLRRHVLYRLSRKDQDAVPYVR